MAKITVGDTHFEVHEEGKGEPLLLVHGSASDYRTWHYQMTDFARHYRVIAYSRRYHWPNDPIAENVDYSMALQVDDLEQIIRTLDLAPVHLVGHSYGAFLCMLMTMRSPELVKDLVLAEPPAITLFVSKDPKPTEILKLLLTRPATAISIMKFGATGVEPGRKAFASGNIEEGISKFADAVFGAGTFGRFSPSKRSSILDNRTNIRAELMGSGFLPVSSAQLQQLKVPTLLVTGQRSMPMFRHIVDRIEELIPNTERVKIPGASHMMQVDNPEAFNKAVLTFLAGKPGSPNLTHTSIRS